MILEAFSKYLQAADPETPAPAILGRWLWEKLSSSPESNEDRVIHCEIQLAGRKKQNGESLELATGRNGPSYFFAGKSKTGRQLLTALYNYSMSYEQQKWSRWVHGVKASDFNQLD